MILFILKRLFYLLISIPLVVLIGFLLIKSSPVDQVERLIDQGEFSLNNEEYARIYKKTARDHGLHLPHFYFSLGTSNYKSDFHQFILPNKKQFYKKLLSASYGFQEIDQLYNLVSEKGAFAQKETKNLLSKILVSSEIEKISHLVQKVELEDPSLFSQLNSLLTNLKNSKSVWYKIFPKLIWHGTHNQYHQSIKNVFSFDLGQSMRDGRSVGSKIWQSFLLTFMMIVLAFFSCFPIAIWLGKKMVIYEKKNWPKIVETLLFMLASIPLFWFATMALSFFTTPEYSKWLNIFPNVSNFDMHLSRNFWKGLINNIHQLILPVLCIILLELAIVTRQVVNLLKKESNLPYMDTARMKGLSSSKIVEKHAYKSARIQMITMMTSGIISALSGSVVIEYIFNIPGIGRLLLDSIKFSDWPVLLGIILLIYILSNIIITISDIISQKFDPRLKLFGNE